MRTLSSAAILAKNKLASVDAWIWLLKVALSPAETAYLARNNEVVTYDGNDYQPFPFEVQDTVEDGQGQPGQLTITTSNVNREMSALIQRYRGMFGAVVTLYLLAGSELVLSDTMKVQSSSVNDSGATFQLGNQDLFSVQTPSGRLYRSRCRFRYQGADCGYVTGSATPLDETQCDRSLWGANGCIAHANAANFGGAPGIPGR